MLLVPPPHTYTHTHTHTHTALCTVVSIAHVIALEEEIPTLPLKNVFFWDVTPCGS
jgi:hypothetical protein